VLPDEQSKTRSMIDLYFNYPNPAELKEIILKVEDEYAMITASNDSKVSLRLDG
jgi:hypothetical protein